MLMKIQFTMPTPERCTEMGIKYEGLYTRTKLWFMGIASALSWVTDVHTEIVFPTSRTIVL